MFLPSHCAQCVIDKLSYIHAKYCLYHIKLVWLWDVKRWHVSVWHRLPGSERKTFLFCSSGIPISTLEPVILREGESFRVAATCRAIGLPPPQLSWDTDVPGQSLNRSSEDGVVTSQYLLHPLRSMNGRKLDCLVWHPALDHPRRLSNPLVVHCESFSRPDYFYNMRFGSRINLPYNVLIFFLCIFCIIFIIYPYDPVKFLR